MKLVDEDEYGAYLGIRPESLKYFTPREINLNFEVYDNRETGNRYIAALCSRIPYDEDLRFSKFGMDFNRAKPTLEEAQQYHSELPEDYKWMGPIAFAAKTKEEYDLKAEIWDRFNKFIWGREPQTVWVAPHSGSVNVEPGDILPHPKNWIDTATAGAAALCALKDSQPVKRNVIYLHATGILGAVLNLGDMGNLDEALLKAAAKKIERKYHSKVQFLAAEFKEKNVRMTRRLLKHIRDRRGTLNPDELIMISRDDSFNIGQIVKGLKFYGHDFKDYTLREFEDILANLGKVEVKVTGTDIFPARLTGERLKLEEKKSEGLLGSALNVECSRWYLSDAPELVADILLDMKRKLFG